MTAFGPCLTTMTTTQEDDYPIYAYSGMPAHASSYPSVYFQVQQPINTYDAYSMQSNQVSSLPTNFVLESQNSPTKYNKHNLQLSTPLYSPTDSAANYFDLQLNVRSVKSESAASIFSSVPGSPLLSLKPQADWTPSHGIGSNVTRQSQIQHQFSVQDNFNYDALALPQKPGFVGKFASFLV